MTTDFTKENMASEYIDKFCATYPVVKMALAKLASTFGRAEVITQANKIWTSGEVPQALRIMDDANRYIDDLSPDLLRAELERVRAEAYKSGVNDGLKKARKIASLFSMKKDRSLHPDIPWEKMNESVQIASHSTAQQIALEINFAMEDEDEE